LAISCAILTMDFGFVVEGLGINCGSKEVLGRAAIHFQPSWASLNGLKSRRSPSLGVVGEHELSSKNH